MNISGVKFEEHYFNISKDILYSVFYQFSCKPHDVITFLTCITQYANISKTLKDIPKRKTPSFFIFKAFQICSNYISYHMHFKVYIY